MVECFRIYDESLSPDQKTQNVEEPAFYYTDVFSSTVMRISQQYGFTSNDYEKDKKAVLAMFDMCRYEEAWQWGNNSVWCSVRNGLNNNWSITHLSVCIVFHTGWCIGAWICLWLTYVLWLRIWLPTILGCCVCNSGRHDGTFN